MAEPARVRVWTAMADHFLDTETRHELPWTALVVIEAGLGVSEARDVWRFEVAPAVGANSWSLAGAWAGWDQAWLVERIEACRGFTWLRRLAGTPSRTTWRAIERCMEALLARPADQRRALAADLDALARHWLDFGPTPLPEERKAQLRRTYHEVFLPIFRPTVVRLAGESPQACAERVERALLARTDGAGGASVTASNRPGSGAGPVP